MVCMKTVPIIKCNLLPTDKSTFKLDFVSIKGANIDHYILRLDEKAGQATRDIIPLHGRRGGGIVESNITNKQT